ncbi:MAG: histidinol-phosphate transaminase [Paracoccaceae bacterium]
MNVKTKSNLDSIAPYKQGQSTIDGVAEPIKLSSNELPYPPSPAAQRAYNETAMQLGRYPDGSQADLRAAISEVHGVDLANLFCSNGSEEGIGLVLRVLLSPDDSVVMSQNSFTMAEIYATASGAEVIKVPEIDHNININGVLAAVRPNTKIVYLCSPNNPTGTYLNVDQIKRLDVELPTDVVLMLDGAYAEFVQADDYDSGLETLFKPEGRVIVTRTFSKGYGMAALRIGWVAAPTVVMNAVSRLRTPFNTNAPALAAAAAAMRDQDYLKSVCKMVNETRDWFVAGLAELGIKVVPSHTNFALIDFGAGGTEANEVDTALQAAGIIARPVSGANNEIRISIGTRDDMKTCLRVISEWWNALTPK